MKKLYVLLAIVGFSGFLFMGCSQSSGSEINQNSSSLSSAKDNGSKDKCSYVSIAEANEILGFDHKKSTAPTADSPVTPCNYYDKKDSEQEYPAYYGLQFHVTTSAMDAGKYYQELIAGNKKAYANYTFKNLSGVGKDASYYFHKGAMLKSSPTTSKLNLWTYDKNSIISISITGRESDTEEQLLEKAKKIAAKILSRI